MTKKLISYDDVPAAGSRLPAAVKTEILTFATGGSGIGPVTVSGTPSAGQVPTALTGTTASWQTPSGGGGADTGIGSVVVSGTPTSGQVPIAATSTTAVWGTPTGGSGVTTGEIHYNVKTYGATGNGSTNDTANVQATINAAAAAATGLTPVVYFPKGTYMVNMLSGYGGNNVTYRGAGKYVSVLKTRTASTDYCLLDLSGTTGVTVENLGFDGSNHTTAKSGIYHNTSTTTSKDLTVRNCWLKDFLPASLIDNLNAAVYVWTSSGVWVENNVINECGRGISIESPNGFCSVTGNTVTAAIVAGGAGRMSTGIRAFQSSGQATTARVVIRGNTVDGGDWDPDYGLPNEGAEGHGICVNRVNDVVIDGNVCYRAGRGILSSYLSFGTIISHNITAYCGDAGIRIEPEISSTSTTLGTAGAARGCQIIGNTCHHNGVIPGNFGMGITASYAAGSIIMGNLIYNNTEFGLHVDSDRTLVIGNTVYNNCQDSTFIPSAGLGNRAGISNYAGQDCIFIGNNVFDNQATKTQAYGLSCPNNVNPLVLGNDFTGNGIAETDHPESIRTIDMTAGQLSVPVNITASTTVTGAHINRTLEYNSASGGTITIPVNTTLVVPVGAWFEVRQVAAGAATVAGAGGVTVQSSGSLTTGGAFSRLIVTKRAANTWVVD